MALGYEDANDAHVWHAIRCTSCWWGRDPIDGEDLASQPTLSRFENAPDRQELLRMSEALADCVIARHRKRLHGRARRITIDLDRPTTPRTASNSSPFSIATTIATVICRWSAFSPSTTRRNSNLVAAVLRPGNVSGSCGAIGILRRLLRRLDSAFPGALFACAWMGVCGAGGSGVSRPPASVNMS